MLDSRLMLPHVNALMRNIGNPFKLLLPKEGMRKNRKIFTTLWVSGGGFVVVPELDTIEIDFESRSGTWRVNK